MGAKTSLLFSERYFMLRFSFPLTLSFLAFFTLTACAGERPAQKADNEAELRRESAEMNGRMPGAQQPGEPTTFEEQYAAQKAANAETGTVTKTGAPKPCFMAIPASQGNANSLRTVQNDPLAKAAMEAINDYLTQKHYEVKSLEGQAQIDAVLQMQNDISGTEADLPYIAGLSLGSDIYITYSYTVSAGQVGASLSAYETSTGRLLASQATVVNDNGNSRQALVESAMRKAMPSLERKVLAYWADDTKNGTQYKLIIQLKGEFSEARIDAVQSEIVTFLKGTFRNVNVNAMTDKTIDAIIYVDSKQLRDGQEVYDAIRTGLEGKYLTKKTSITHKFILMELR